MTARTYTPEAIEKLVKAARDARVFLIEADTQEASDLQGPLDEALRPFTTEPSSWLAYLRERWGDEWQAMGDGPTHEDFLKARGAYRARYGVEPC